MQCPKCKGDFEQVKFNGIEIDRCLNCKGLWFDMMEKEDMLLLNDAESVDVGSRVQGENYNAMRNIECPKCGVHMIPMVDKDQFHIQFESCATCYGTFFDAGEFTDLKDYTVVERFIGMLSTLRRNLD